MTNSKPKFSYLDKPLECSISDSFLERAMDTHMSEEDYAEAEKNSKKLSIGVADEDADQERNAMRQS